MNRMLAMESNVDSQKLRTGTLTDADWDAVVEGIGTIGNSKLIIDDTPGISVMELRSKCRKVKLEYGLDLVMIDYLQPVSYTHLPALNQRECGPAWHRTEKCPGDSRKILWGIAIFV